MQMWTRYGCQIVACLLEQYLQINTGQVTFVFRWECGIINKHEGVNAAFSKMWTFLFFLSLSLSVCVLTHQIIIVALMLLPAAALAKCKLHPVLRLIGDLPVTRLLNPNIWGAKPPPPPGSDPSRPLCVCAGVRTQAALSTLPRPSSTVLPSSWRSIFLLLLLSPPLHPRGGGGGHTAAGNTANEHDRPW